MNDAAKAACAQAITELQQYVEWIKKHPISDLLKAKLDSAMSACNHTLTSNGLVQRVSYTLYGTNLHVFDNLEPTEQEKEM